MRKKIITAVLVLAMSLSLCSCRIKEEPVQEIAAEDITPEATPEATPEVTEEPEKEQKAEEPVEVIEIDPLSVIELEDGTVAISAYNLLDSELIIPEKIEGKTVSAIADYAFESNNQVEKITLPSTVTSVGDGAFSGCVNLIEISLSKNLETIGKGAFLSCSSLTQIEIPDSVTEIGDFAFAMCGRLTGAKVSESIKAIPNRLFYACENLSEVNIPDSVNTIGKRAFSRCKSLSDIDIPRDVVYIGEFAFESCQSLTEIIFPCEVVEKGTFCGSFDLSKIIFATDITSIGERAFENTQVDIGKIPASVEYIGDGAFANDRMIREFNVAEGSKFYTAKDGVLYTEDMKTLISYPAEKEGDSYEIPKDVEKISAGAFKNTTNLLSVTIPETVKIIGAESFIYSGIESVEIPAAVVSIGNSAFEYCANLKEVKINKGTELIGERAFANCGSLEEIYLPDSIKVIKAYAFDNDDEIVLRVPEENEEVLIYESSVYNPKTSELIYNIGRSYIGSVAVPDGIITISENAFKDNKYLREVIMPDSVAVIEEGAFPENVYFIGSENAAARTYAFNHSFGYFAAVPDYTDKEITVAGGENAQIVVDYAYAGDIAYSSSDTSIAIVDQNGVVTGQGIGFCDVYAVVGNCFFKTVVTVSSDAENKIDDGFDRSSYLGFKQEGEDVEKWVESYKRANATISLRTEDNPYTTMYKGEVIPYYRPMVAAQAGIDLDKRETESFGDDYKEMFLMMDHGAETELTRYHQTDDMRVFTGVYDYQITDAVGDVHNLVEVNRHIGEEFTLNTLVSTSILEDAACGFGDTLFVIYGTKEAFDEVGCGYIDMITDSVEKEILMSEDARYQIIGCGILLNRNELTQQSTYKKYIELNLLGK